MALIGCADKPKKSLTFDKTCIEGLLYYRNWSPTSDSLTTILQPDGKPMPCPQIKGLEGKKLRPLPQIQPPPKGGQ